MFNGPLCIAPVMAAPPPGPWPNPLPQLTSNKQPRQMSALPPLRCFSKAHSEAHNSPLMFICSSDSGMYSATSCSSPKYTNFFDLLREFKQYSRLCLEKWATPAYDTVDPRNAGHMAKTQSSHVYTRGLSYVGGKLPRHKANL